MSSADGLAPPFLWPPRLTLPTAKTIYLDLNHWVSLAKANTGHRDGSEFKPVLEACADAAARGFAFPISGVTYIEVSKIRDPRQRRDLADVITLLSGHTSVLSHPLIVQFELDAAISARLGVPSRASQDLPYLGSGVGWAFGGRLTPTFTDATGQDRRVELMATLQGQQVISDMTTDFEFYALSGPDDEEAEQLRAGGWSPDAAWQTAVQRAESERVQAGLFDAVHQGVGSTEAERLAAHTADRRDWRRGRLRDAIAVRELTRCIGDVFGEVLSWYGQPSLEQLWGDRTGARTFLRQMPSSEVAVELKTVLHRDRARAKRWKPNDVLDIDQLSITVPYCDVGVSEKAACDALIKARLDERCQTVVLTRLSDLSPHI